MKGIIIAVLIAGSLSVSGCAKSCQDKAQAEWMKQQEQIINNGGSNSIGGYFTSLDQYTVEKCGSNG